MKRNSKVFAVIVAFASLTVALVYVGIITIGQVMNALADATASTANR